MNHEDKTAQGPGLNDATERNGVNDHSAVNGNNSPDNIIGTVICGYTVQSLLSDVTGEARIYKASKNYETFVVKYYKQNYSPKEDILKKIQNLDHPDIIKLYEYGHHNGRFFEVMEYAEGGTLGERDGNGKFKYLPLSEESVVKLISETVNAFKYLHEKGITHRDIKPANLFFRNTDCLDIVIGDFGISSLIDVEGGLSWHITSNRARTDGYAAPENYASGFQDGKETITIAIKMDYYSLGITIYELLTGTDFIKGREMSNFVQDTIYGRIYQDFLSRPEAADFTPRIKRLLQGLLTVIPEKRWGYDEVTDWLKGKDVPVYEGVQVLQFPTLKFGGKTLNTIDEIVAAIDSNREEGKKSLHHADLEKWAAKFDEKIGTEITNIRELDIDKDRKVSMVLFMLAPGRPCRIDGRNSISNLIELITLLRNEPGLMADVILEEKKSDLYPWLEKMDRDLASMFKKAADTFRRREGNPERLSLVSNIYLSLAGEKICPFPGDDYQVSSINDILKIPEHYRDKAVNELNNRGSILYVWLMGQKIPGGFEEDWASMPKTWTNFVSVLSGNTAHIREQKKKEAERIPNRYRRLIAFFSFASCGTIVLSGYIMLEIISGFFELPGLSPYAYDPVPKQGAVIYEKNELKSKRIYAKGNLVFFQSTASENAVSAMKDNDLFPVKYYSAGSEKTGFMKKKDLDITYRSMGLLGFFVPMYLLGLFAFAGLFVVMIKRGAPGFFDSSKREITAATVICTMGAALIFIVPLRICYTKYAEIR